LANSTRVELEDEPFARPSAWRGPLARSVAGAIGLVGAVLSGMVLLDASAGEPATVSAEQLSVPAAAVALLPSTPTPAQPARDAPQETPSVPAATIAPIEARGHVAPSHAASHSHSFTRTATAAHPPRRPVAHEINEPTDTGARETPKPAREVAAVERGSAAPGTLRINSRPWSQVYVDGRLVGTTPQMGIEVQPGSHSVRLLNAEFSMSKTFQIAVASGKTVTRVEMLTE
jgi:hypothetical protein